jgi:citrate lyase beta subunit
MVEKAATLAADHLFSDLEDATPPAGKEAARRTVIEALTTLDYGERLVACAH